MGLAAIEPREAASTAVAVQPCRDASVRPGQELWVIVLAGGEGRRLQAFVNRYLGTSRPKQFCAIVGSRTMLRQAWDRALRLTDPERIVTVITAGQEGYLEAEHRQGIPGHVLIQPENKETAPGVLWPLLFIRERAANATVVVLPADHYVGQEDLFASHVRMAVTAARRWPDRIAMLGVEPTEPEVGYGWIAPGAPLPSGAVGDVELYAVRRFWEKPDAKTATMLFSRGYLWNILVLAGHVATYLRLAAESLPDVLRPLRDAVRRGGSVAPDAAVREAYRKLPESNFSEEILVRRPEDLVVVVTRGVEWSDWGDADRIARSVERLDQRPAWWARYALQRLRPARPTIA